MKQKLEKFRMLLTTKDCIIIGILVVISALLAPFGIQEFWRSMVVVGYGGELAFVGMVFPCLVAFKIRSILKR